jgi:hypothetical protein
MRKNTDFSWVWAFLIIGGALGIIGWVQYMVIRDCGLLGLLRGAEIFWAFGGCSH